MVSNYGTSEMSLKEIAHFSDEGLSCFFFFPTFLYDSLFSGMWKSPYGCVQEQCVGSQRNGGHMN